MVNTKTSKGVYKDFLIDGHTNYDTAGQGGDKWEKNKGSRSETMDLMFVGPCIILIVE